MNTTSYMQIAGAIRKVPHRVTLVAVTKSVGIDETNETIKAGVGAIGENRVEDFEGKIGDLLPVEKHFIGQIQSRKIKRIVELFDVMQSVDSIRHLKLIEDEALRQNKDVRLLLQFNISGEEQKGGFSQDAIGEILKAITGIHRVKIIGVMGIASHTADTGVVREQFRLLKKLRDQLREKHSAITELSMGMSGDYKIALEEGATMVRIGSLLFK